MNDRYFSVKEEASASIKVDGSRFIADVFPAESEEEAKSHVAAVKKKYFDATHHCFAYVVGGLQNVVRYSDDGEPSGTAGVKIAAAVESAQLFDLVVVVTRYYGGTKLGVGGLGRTYFEAAKHVLTTAPLIQKAVIKIMQVKFQFPDTNPVMNIIHSQSLRLAGSAYTEHAAELTVHVPLSKAESVHSLLIDATRGTAEITQGMTMTAVWE